MAARSSGDRTSRELKRNEVNLVSARSGLNTEFNQYSRTAKSGGYAKQRARKDRTRKILVGVTIVMVSALAAILVGLGWLFWANNEIQKDLNISSLSGVTVDRVKPEDPFWMLLVGTDFDEGGISRSDSIILAHVNPGTKSAALVSIPRDTRVQLPGYGYQKINAAYAYGEMERLEGKNHSGAEFAVQAVSELTGVGISSYAQIDIGGFQGVVDALGGVFVDVPMDIIGDTDAGWVDVYAGPQILDGAHALVFCRSRQYAIGDFQRQANQRVFLQATAKQILASDPLTIINTVTKICEMTSTNMNIGDIASVANSMRGMQPSDIHTYSIPSVIQDIDGISFVVADVNATRELCAAINSGEYPDASTWNYQGESAPEYQAKTTPAATDRIGELGTGVDTSLYTVDVRNGYGTPGAATSVSDMLALAGYKQGEIGNANTLVYEETLIIYKGDEDREAALDIKARLGYGRVIPSLERYSFEGNLLVVVGADFVP
jgi:LCP family protein required for cell wall assembly